MPAQLIETADFVAEATDWIAASITEAQTNGSECVLSLCGGGTPKPIYAALSKRDGIDWSRVIVTFGDERTVPPDHDDSNYRMACEAFLNLVPIAEENVLRIKGELPPAEAASAYETALKAVAARRNETVLRHDVLLLGMGDDGHTASLFPETTALKETDRWAIENFVPKFDTHRITMTYPLINAARRVAFLTTGAGKRDIVDRVIAGSDDPASKVSPNGGAFVWFHGA